MTVRYHHDIEQGSDEWLELRRGKLTASEMHLIVTPPPKPDTRIKKDGTPYKKREHTAAENAALRAHVYEIAAQRISEYVEPTFISDAMLRGRGDEELARALYQEHTGRAVTICGFVENHRYDFPLGYSPDGLVGDDGLIEAKSRDQKFQVQTFAEFAVPREHVIQCQTALLVTCRKWLDFLSYSGGLPMAIIRVWPDLTLQGAIVDAARAFEERVAEVIALYAENSAGFPPTERALDEDVL